MSALQAFHKKSLFMLHHPVFPIYLLEYLYDACVYDAEAGLQRFHGVATLEADGPDIASHDSHGSSSN